MRRMVGPGIGVILSALALSTVQAVTTAVVEHPHGHVEMRAANSADWTEVTPGDKLTQGSSVRTSDDGQVDLVTTRGHRFHLKSSTTLTLTSLVDDETAVHLDKGSVLSTVKKLKSSERFSIDTPTAVCAVRGTQFETIAGEKETFVAVYKGIVGVALAGSGAAETAVRAGMMTAVHDGRIELPRMIPRIARTAAETALSRAAHHEVGLDMTRVQVIASAALERRLADYQEGKSLIDASGHRVRLEEYIVRPEPNQFKLVALDERGSSQLDYFFYLGTFNKNLPTDLSVALRDLNGTLGAIAPDYYLTGYEMGQSNTVDSVHDIATGGHLVKITLDNSGNFTLADPTDNSNTYTIPGAQAGSGSTYSVYNPLTDSFSTVTAAQLASATKFGVYIPENETFHDLAAGDTLWETRFNTYQHALDDVSKISYAKNTTFANVLSATHDAAYTYWGGSLSTSIQSDPANEDETITTTYGDGSFESYRTVLINDQGGIAPQSAFAGASTGAAFNDELLKWNYEQQVSATVFQGRKIDLVVEPRIFLESGLIQ